MKQYAFYFDSSSCSGCKACQVACKDRHGLRVGLLWRRVYEVTGGTWTRRGEAWISSVFAYHVSLACNHCEQPICAEVCPTGATAKRADGIVLIDPDKCIGCRYCSWACPYGAPQYDAEAGRMTKCTFCAEDLGAGLPPSCVAACPLRALDFGERTELEARYKASHLDKLCAGSESFGSALRPWALYLSSRTSAGGPRAQDEPGRRACPEPSRRAVEAVYPLPEADLTEPALVLTPHKDALRAAGESARVGNWEEVNAP
jgi:anaerobic dimethyl sulfoxide reductase subunit B (iron-sulfur subunit)